MKTIAVIQARTGSERLPGKVLADLAGRSMLERVFERTRRAERVDEVVVATTELQEDDPIEHLCLERDWPCFRGSEMDLLDRYYQTARLHGAEVVVRVTSDCPLIDPGIIDRVVEEFFDRLPECDYASNTLDRRTFPRGLDTEIMTAEALGRAWREDSDPTTREHVTPFFYRHRELFRLHAVENDTDLSHLRWTVDTPEDLTFVSHVYGHFGSDRFSWRDVLAALDEHPEWIEINERVVQKEL